jgi:hypothetical protein
MYRLNGLMIIGVRTRDDTNMTIYNASIRTVAKFPGNTAARATYKSQAA